MKRWIGYIVLGIAFLALVSMGVMQNSDQQTRESFYSSYDNGPKGYLALYNVLSARGVKVSRYEHDVALLPPKATVVISSWQPEIDSPDVLASEPISGDDKRLRAYAKAGGHVVLLDASGLFSATSVGKSSKNISGAHASPVVAGPLDAGVEQTDAPFTYLEDYKALRTAYPLLGTSAGAFAFVEPVGNGDIVYLTSASVFANANLAKGDNMLLAYNLLARGAPVYFDERLHGYSADKSFWGALPEAVHVSVYLLGAVLIAFLVDANIRVAPAIPADPPDERDSSAYVSSMARLLRRARAGSAAVQRFADDAERALRHRDRPDLATALNELRRLAALPRPNNADVQRAAALHALIRKDTP